MYINPNQMSNICIDDVCISAKDLAKIVVLANSTPNVAQQNLERLYDDPIPGYTLFPGLCNTASGRAGTRRVNDSAPQPDIRTQIERCSSDAS